MVLFRSFLILVLLNFLNQHVNLVQCFRHKCKFNVADKTLDCSNRNLTRIPDHLFSLKYAKIKLANNAFVCDCSISWFLDGIKNIKNRRRIIDLESLKCDSPDYLRSQYLAQLNRDIVCYPLPELLIEAAAEIPNTTEPITEETTPFPDPCLSDDIPKCDPRTEICVRNGNLYECHCKPGFKTKAGQCEAFDACLGNNNCSKHAQCINKIGSYKCICKSGYVGDGMNCKDKNECENKESNECHKYALCINEDGGYKCRCRNGFEQHKEGRVCVRKNEVSTKAIVMAGLIAGIPLFTFVALTIYLCKRCLRRKALERQAVNSPENPPNDDVMPSDDQQLILGADSYYEESIPMRGLPPSESAWSEWPDYDDTRGSDSD